MKLNLITYASVLARQEVDAIRAAHAELINALEQHFEVNMQMASDGISTIDTENTLVFVATGGTEGMVVRDYEKLPHPLVLLTDGKANSLAASLELSCWVRNKGEQCRVLHGKVEDIAAQVQEILGKGAMHDVGTQVNSAVQSVAKCPAIPKRIGVMGEPSDWLVSSDVNYAKAHDAWEVEYVDIALAEIEAKYAQISDERVGDIVEHFCANAVRCVEPSRDDIVKAARLYLAIKQVAEEYRLDALTVQCFNLIPTTGTTGCLALALLNDEGIVAGCEGDLQTIFTMLATKEMLGIDGFMANPAFVDLTRNEMIFAHCTIGIKQTNEYIIRSHFESMSGVAVQGILPCGDVTVVKFGGDDLRKVAILEGNIVENQDDARKCRTQIRIAFEEGSHAAYFLNESIGNHHVILQGHHAKRLRELMNLTK